MCKTVSAHRTRTQEAPTSNQLRNRVKHGALMFLPCLAGEVLTRPTHLGKTTSSRHGETLMTCRQMQTLVQIGCAMPGETFPRQEYGMRVAQRLPGVNLILPERKRK
jgi:hypothetical protein